MDQKCKKCSGIGKIKDDFIPFAGGSMGMGLASGVALAWSKKQLKEPGTVYVIESDGGMQEGSTWEAVMFAAQHDLDNLVLIVDLNGFQAMGMTANIIPMHEIHEVLEKFGWNWVKVDGHDFSQLNNLFIHGIKFIRNQEVGPIAIIAQTVKGKGASFMENNNLYHYKQLSEDEYERAKMELTHGKVSAYIL